MQTRTTGAGIRLIKRFEACKLKWYVCPAGRWTIGYGTTEGLLGGVTREALPRGIDAAAADHLLRRALAQIFEPAIERLVEVPITSYQFDALTSFTYNVGVGNFRRSTLRDKVLARDFDAAAEEFSRWIYADGKVWKGLVKRREAERSMFEGEERRALEVRPERMAPRRVERIDLPPIRIERLRGHIPTADEVTRPS